MEDARRFILSVSTRRCFEFLRDGWHDGVSWIGSRCGGNPKCYTTQKKPKCVPRWSVLLLLLLPIYSILLDDGLVLPPICVGAEILGKGMSRQLEELQQQQPEILSMLCLSQRTLTKVRSSHIGVCVVLADLGVPHGKIDNADAGGGGCWKFLKLSGRAALMSSLMHQ
ncbi:hypothetical protein Pmani_021533 [Petrolisthes manimaculis]|uniref:Uncharacterized protein n=1 Tax=Petrolisthes manimaculis TaxID=1843537 RepID=A0AAE1P8I5_9EUCA|nr:hypothetical protein Pmani_025166 [Petrolisthes manimaculis]KAK4306639.1 hypothetical protein Pmani_021533 [Petrolisthes manimaculis]